jgi:hypothetical protein
MGFLFLSFAADCEDYTICFNITMPVMDDGDNPEMIATYYLRQHVEKQREVLWNILLLQILFSFFLSMNPK